MQYIGCLYVQVLQLKGTVARARCSKAASSRVLSSPGAAGACGLPAGYIDRQVRVLQRTPDMKAYAHWLHVGRVTGLMPSGSDIHALACRTRTNHVHLLPNATRVNRCRFTGC